MKNYDVLNELVPRTQELHRAIFDKGYEQGQKDILEQLSCEDCISRQATVRRLCKIADFMNERREGLGSPYIMAALFIQDNKEEFPPVTSKEKIGHCKDCKYFEYDSVAKVDGIPLIVAHEICSKWGDGCKTKEDGYCFLFEPQEGENKEIENEQNKIRTLGKTESQQR